MPIRAAVKKRSVMSVAMTPSVVIETAGGIGEAYCAASDDSATTERRDKPTNSAISVSRSVHCLETSGCDFHNNVPGGKDESGIFKPQIC
jgi:hypothetical protein